MAGISLLIDRTSIRKITFFGQGKISMRCALDPGTDIPHANISPGIRFFINPFKINGKKRTKNEIVHSRLLAYRRDRAIGNGVRIYCYEVRGSLL
jgi:hypothetical protein